MNSNHSISFKRIGIMSIFLILCTLGVMLTSSNRASALATTAVTTTAIKDDPNDGQCDLWEAMQGIADFNNATDFDQDGSPATYHECSTGPGPHIIMFLGAATGGTITLPTDLIDRPFSGLPYVTDDVTITGPIVIDGGGAAINAHIFTTNAGGKLTLMNMVVQNGYTSGGGGAIVGFGGDDVINIIASSIQNNTAEGNGGAINVVGQVNVLMSNFSGNKALGLDGAWGDAFGQGGAIYQTGYNSINISLSNFAGNIASDGGGAIFTMADSGQITDTVFNGNIVSDDVPTEYTHGGAAIHNGGNNSDTGLMISRVAFNGNLSFNANGGAIFNAPDGYLHIYDSSFNGNIAGTLVFNQYGGGIYNQEVLDIQRVMFLGNVASSGVSLNDDNYGHGGAVANDRTGIASFANVSFTANGAPGGFGGGVWNGQTQQAGPASYVYLYNTTFSLNTSLNNDGAAIYNQTDGSHAVYVGNTIVDGLGVGGNNCNEALNSLGHNIDSGNTCGFNQEGDQPDTDPGIKTLDFNGGPFASLLSHGLNSDSNAIDAGDNAICANDYVHNLDQRSDPRPKGNACDVGAFESDEQVSGYGSLPIPPGPVVIGNTSVGTPIVNSLKVLNIGNIDLEISNPQITGSNPDQFEVVIFPSPITYQDDIVIRCLATAEGNFTALFGFTTSAPEVPAVAYQLECNVNPAPTAGYGSDPIAPGTLDFGQVEVGNGDTSVQTLTYFETGNTTLTVNGAELSGPNPADFTFNGFDTTILDGDPPADLPVTCTPTDFGVRTATLSLATTDPTQATVSYNLVCEGIAPPSPPLDPTGSLLVLGADGASTHKSASELYAQSGDTPDVLDGPYDIAISPDGLNAYVTSYVNDTLTVYSRDAETGALSQVMVSSNVDMIGPAMVEVSPDGKQVYVTSIDSDTFVIFSRLGGTGIVSLETAYRGVSSGGTIPSMDYPFGLSVSQDGRFIYVTSFSSNSIVTFSRGVDDFVGYEGVLVDNTNLVYPYLPAMSPDGKHIYISGGATGNDPIPGYVSVFERDTLDGSLTFVEQIAESDPGCFIFCIWGLSHAWGISVSPDGKNVYVVGNYDNSVVRFTRNQFDGTLSYNGYITNGTLELTEPISETESVETEGLTGAFDVKVSPDGKYVYVTAYSSSAISVFTRNPGNGSLTQVQVLYTGGGVTLGGAREIGLSPDGTSVYATAYTDDAIQSLQIANPIATLSAMLPSSAEAGSGGLTITVQGENFVPGSVAQVNGTDRPTAFNHPGEIEVTLFASDLSSAGTLTLDVLNPAPGGGNAFNTLVFTVTGAGQYPIPSIESLLPGGVDAGGPDLTVTINGYNFVSASTVQWNGSNRAKTFINSTQLEITVTSEDLLTPGPVVLTVTNPGPGGGTSNVFTFDVAGPGNNPVPAIQSIEGWITLAHGAASTPVQVHIFGSNFMLDTQAQWNGQNRPTQFVSENEVIITLNGFDVAFGGSGAITVVNPGPGGGASNPATFYIYAYAAYIPIIVK